MRKFLCALLILFLLLTPVLSGCGDNPAPVQEPSIEEIKEKIESYFEVIFPEHLFMLVHLNLMTRTQAESLQDNNNILTLPDGRTYWDTGVSFADFEQACLRYLSKNYFDSFNHSDWHCMDVLDGNLIYYADSGHGGTTYKGVGEVTFLRTSGSQYWYSAAIEFWGEDSESSYFYQYEFAFVLENGNYVVDYMSLDQTE